MTAIDFAIWDHFERRRDVALDVQYREKIGVLQQAERMGFRAYHIAEHHLTPLDLAPSPNVFLAALAQATTTLRFGSMVYIAPLYHPLRLVQEICMLDQLSGGRLEFGVGKGVRPIEHEWYGLDTQDAHARCEEILSILAQGLASGHIDYEGRFYQLRDVKLDLSPMQRPHPPIWYAGGVEFAGKRGLNFLGRGLQQIRRYWELWEQTRASGEHYDTGPQPAPRVGIMHHMMLAPTEAKAMAIARRAWPAYVHNFQATPLSLRPGHVIPGPQDFEAELKRDLRIIGSAARAQDFIGRFLEELGPTPTFYFAGAFQWGDVHPGEALDSMQIFAEEVMPLFKPARAPQETS